MSSLQDMEDPSGAARQAIWCTDLVPAGLIDEKGNSILLTATWSYRSKTYSSEKRKKKKQVKSLKRGV